MARILNDYELLPFPFDYECSLTSGKIGHIVRWNPDLTLILAKSRLSREYEIFARSARFGYV